MTPARVRRRAQACARCRLRKVHCDALPAGCSLCAEAGVACVALNAATRQALPRSIAQFLETQIAERERQRGLWDGRPGPSRPGLAAPTVRPAPPPPPSTRPLLPPPDRVFAPPALGALLDGITPAFLGLSAAVPLARCVVAGTRLPSAREVLGEASRPGSEGSQGSLPGSQSSQALSSSLSPPAVPLAPRSPPPPPPPATPLSSIPVHVADFLFDNYVSRVAPQYPLYYTPDLVAMHQAVVHGQAAPAWGRAYATYTLHLIMAISLSTAARAKQARANAIAGGLFAAALAQLPGVLSNDLRGLQALILLTQYTFLNPGVANFWLLTGFISQACIDLGLHQELPADDDARRVGPLERDMRRRVFWCAYEMEVAVCGALLRPITLLRRHVTTAFPSELDDAAITAAGIDVARGRATKFTSHLIWRYRVIECDIVPVLFHGEAVPGGRGPAGPEGPEGPEGGGDGREEGDLAAWMARQEQAILAWKAEIHARAAANTDAAAQSLWDEMRLYGDIASDYILVTLFRPSPRLRDPPAANLLKAFAAAVGVADGSWQQANLAFGGSKYVFHACYHSFSAAIAFLQALQRATPAVAAAYPWPAVEANMRAFARFFATVAERWPAAERCLEEYERLLAPVKKDVAAYYRAQEEAAAAAARAQAAARAAARRSSEHYLWQQLQQPQRQHLQPPPLQGQLQPLAPDDLDLDEALRFGPFFHAAAAPGLGPLDALDAGLGGGSAGWPPFAPMDWNEEFGFGF